MTNHFIDDILFIQIIDRLERGGLKFKNTIFMNLIIAKFATE